jgi:energy-coupling factor transporter ATP-binding protein EcfA2
VRRDCRTSVALQRPVMALANSAVRFHKALRIVFLEVLLMEDGIENMVQVTDVFTPSSVATKTFVARESINDKLVDALRTKGKQVIVYGHSGCGKTTLLENKLTELFSLHIKTSCMKGMTFEQILADPLRQLNAMYVVERAGKNATKLSTNVSTPKEIVIPVGFSFEKTYEISTKSNAVAPNVVSPHIVADFLGVNGACWVLEDFHKVDPSEKVKLSQCMKMFMDLSARYPDLKMIFIGAVRSAHEVVGYDPELRNRVAEIPVPLMTDDELRQIVAKGESALNIQIDKRIVESIVAVSNGLAAVTHQLALTFCQMRGIEVSQKERCYLDTSKWMPALERYIESASDSLRIVFEKSVKDMKKRKYDHGRVILAALTKFPQSGVNKYDLLAKIRESEPAYPPSSLASNLLSLQSEDRCSIISCDQNTQEYSFSEPVHRAFCYMLFESEQKSRSKSSEKQIPVSDMLKRLVPELAELLAKLEKVSNGHNSARNTPKMPFLGET